MVCPICFDCKLVFFFVYIFDAGKPNNAVMFFFIMGNAIRIIPEIQSVDASEAKP